MCMIPSNGITTIKFEISFYQILFVFFFVFTKNFLFSSFFSLSKPIIKVMLQWVYPVRVTSSFLCISNVFLDTWWLSNVLIILLNDASMICCCMLNDKYKKEQINFYNFEYHKYQLIVTFVLIFADKSYSWTFPIKDYVE